MFLLKKLNIEDQRERQTHPWLILFRFRFDIRIIQFRISVNISKAVYFKRVTGIEREAIHSSQSKSSLIGGPEFDENKSLKNSQSVLFVLYNGFWTHPLLLSLRSSQGTNTSSTFMGAPFLENSLEIFASSLSSLLLSITGTPSTTNVLSSPSSK
jgi:hypothetical protein